MLEVFYSVLVGNIGYVSKNDTPDYASAYGVFQYYCEIARSGTGSRAYHEQVSLWASNEHDPIATNDSEIIVWEKEEIEE